MDGDDKAPRVASAKASAVAMLAQVDPLPGAECKAAVRDGDGERVSHKSGLDVTSNIVRTLVHVVEQALRSPAFWYNHIECLLYVCPHYGFVGV